MMLSDFVTIGALLCELEGDMEIVDRTGETVRTILTEFVDPATGRAVRRPRNTEAQNDAERESYVDGLVERRRRRLTEILL